MNKTWDETVLSTIITQLDSEGIRTSNIVHIGNNIFEMDYDDTAFLAGTFGKMQCELKDGKAKILKRQVEGMS